MLFEMRLAVLALALLLAGVLWAQKKQPPTSPINVNTATAAQLKTLPGLGDSMAREIIRFREKNGRFRRVEDLLIIKGISKRKLDSWKPYLKTTEN